MVNSFQLPNSVVDEILPVISSNACKCYMVVVRQTTGWNKCSDKISLSQLSLKTGLKSRTIIRAMNELIDHGLVKRAKKNGSVSQYSVERYDIKTNDTGVTGFDKKSDKPVTRLSLPRVLPVSSLSLGSVRFVTGGSVRFVTLQNNTITKDTITKIYMLVSGYWNDRVSVLGKPRFLKWTETRKAHFNARCDEDKNRDLTWWKNLIDSIPEHAMAMQGDWFTLEWLIKSENNLIKFLEGKYKNSINPNPLIPTKGFDQIDYSEGSNHDGSF